MTQRTDPFMTRARELCAADGKDPDARAPKPGSGRGQPMWCLYRQAARDESVAAEQARLAADRSIAPQSAEYQDAPLRIFGDHEPNTLAQMRECMRVGNVVGGTLCADGHLGYAQPVGAVIAYDGQVSISGVGFDIACGNMAIKVDLPYLAIADRRDEIAREIGRRISFGMGRTNETRVDHELFDDAEMWRTSGMEDYRQKARTQLGTVGSGNHYVDILKDDHDCVWIGVHFGSRGLGHTTATRYLKAAGGRDGMNVPPTVINEASEIGERYIAGMTLAGRYAYAGREWVTEEVRRIIGSPEVLDTVHNHHNFAWREEHSGRNVWVVRKGATPCQPGQRGFIGGSMGDDAVIVEGTDGDEAVRSLYSTVHGAGRNFGRKEAIRRFTRAEMDEWLRRQDVDVHLLGGGIDESPMAYKRLPDVLACHSGSTRVQHRLSPKIVVMAGPEVEDPWKD